MSKGIELWRAPAPRAILRTAHRGYVAMSTALLLPLYSTGPGIKLADRFGLRRRAFERAYGSGAWTRTGESLSGTGSGLEATEQVRAALPGAIRDLAVRVLLDVPCGDWNWMRHVDLPVDRYIGGDLLPSIVERNRARFGSERHQFREIDLCTDRLPDADLLLCRDALIHFANADIWRAINNVARSKITFLATTTFPATPRNKDLISGIRWRHLNLQAAPFNFPPPLTSLPDGFNRPDKVLSIWRVSDLGSRGETVDRTDRLARFNDANAEFAEVCEFGGADDVSSYARRPQLLPPVERRAH